jgi:hypothetical protein
VLRKLLLLLQPPVLPGIAQQQQMQEMQMQGCAMVRLTALAWLGQQSRSLQEELGTSSGHK